MLTKTDTGQRKLLIQCDLYGIFGKRPHTKLFKGPDAQTEAEVFARTRDIQDRAMIEMVLELPESPAEYYPRVKRKLEANPDTEITTMIRDLTQLIITKETPDTPDLREAYKNLKALLKEQLK
jgi:hypothetical protein